MDEHISAMARPSNREKLLCEGLRVVHERGFAGASVRDIVQAAGVPQGSFTNHFASKEAFGLEIIERYYAAARAQLDETLANPTLSPLQRLRAWIHAAKEQLACDDMRRGCLLGNFAAEASEHSEPIRRRLTEIFAETESAIAGCLRAAIDAGELPAGFDCPGTAGFILAALQGANLLAKAQRSPAPVERFEQILFSRVLR